jgi:DNA-binding PadR family transcriptional regulator
LKSAAAEAFVPLKPDVFAVLLVLLEGDAHGYAIMQRAPAQSTGTGRLQAGALYRILKRMLDDGLIDELDREPVEDAADQRRRSYRITALGRDVAAAEARRMAELLAFSRAHQLLERT